MKVYVDELPKMCKECHCVKENLVVDMGTSWVDYYCKLQHKDNDHSWCYKLGENLEEEYKQCPLVSITDYTKQVRKEVCEEIKAEFDTSNANQIDEKLYPPTQEAILIGKGFKACKERLFKKLDKIEQGETK